MTTATKESRGLKQRIAEAFIGWIYQEILKIDEKKTVQDERGIVLKAKAHLPDEPIKMVPCVHCKREISEFNAYCAHCQQFQEELKEDVTQPLYWIELNHERHFFQLESGRPLIDGKRPFEAYLEAMHKNEEWLL